MASIEQELLLALKAMIPRYWRAKVFYFGETKRYTAQFDFIWDGQWQTMAFQFDGTQEALLSCAPKYIAEARKKLGDVLPNNLND